MIEGALKDLKGMAEGLRRELARLKEEEKFERDVAFKCELLTRAIKGTHHSSTLTLCTDCSVSSRNVLLHMGQCS
jgi:hypothetical protein